MVSVLPFCSRVDGYTSHRGALQAKMVYVASLNDQVVPIYSGLFTAASHPLILRALYIDGDAYQCVSPFSFFPSLSLILLSDLSRVPVPSLSSSSDFLSNLLVLLLRMLNSGISDSGLLVHLSEATAGSLNGVGHSTAYEEVATYSYVLFHCALGGFGYPFRLSPGLQISRQVSFPYE